MTPAGKVRDELVRVGVDPLMAALLAEKATAGSAVVTLPWAEAHAMMAGDGMVVEFASYSGERIATFALRVVGRDVVQGTAAPFVVVVVVPVEEALEPSWLVRQARLNTRRHGPLRLDIDPPPELPAALSVARGELDGNGIDTARRRR